MSELKRSLALDESLSVAVSIDAKKESVLGKMLGDAVRPAIRVTDQR
jgi:hypothetical protein